MTYRHFRESEVRGLAPWFVHRLDRARSIAGVPFVITSGARTPEETAAAGGVEDSSHDKGEGVDLAAGDSRTRSHMIRGLVLAGFDRMGIYPRHIHVDADATKPNHVTWLGKYKKKGAV